MKITVMSDPHIDRTNIETNLIRGFDMDAGVKSNWLESYKQFNQCIDMANEFGADYILNAGDTFDEGIPIPDAVKRLDDSMKRLDPRCKMIVAGGNHDQRGPTHNQATPIDAYMEGKSWCLRATNNTEVVDVGGFKFVIVPWHKVAGTKLVDDVSTTMEQEIDRVAQECEGHPSVLFGHFTLAEMQFGSARRGAEVTISNQPEAVIKTQQLDDGPWTNWFAGHVHKHQVVSDKGVIVGSTYKISFKERNETKGVYNVEYDDTTGDIISYDFVELPDVRNLHQIDLSNGGHLTQAMVDQIGPHDVVRLTIDIDQALTPAQSNKIDELRKMGVNVQFATLPRVRHQNESKHIIAMDTTPDRAFDMYAIETFKDKEPDMIPRVNAAFREIMNAEDNA